MRFPAHDNSLVVTTSAQTAIIVTVCCNYILVALTLFVGWQEGHLACKKTEGGYVGGGDITEALFFEILLLSPPPLHYIQQLLLQ